LDADVLEIPRGEIHLVKERCKGCGFCVEYCPRNVLEQSDEFNSKGYYLPVVQRASDCVHCRLCEILCPEFALFVTLKDDLSAARTAAPAGGEEEDVAP